MGTLDEKKKKTCENRETNVGERPSFGFAICDPVTSGTDTVAVEFLRDVDLRVEVETPFSPRFSPPSDILFLFVDVVVVEGRGRSDFLVSSFAPVRLLFTAFF